MLARLILGAMLVLGFGQTVFAGCTCSLPGGDCGRGWNTGQVIFLGKVTADTATEAPVEDSAMSDPGVTDPPTSSHRIKKPPMNHVVHFSIAESFRGEIQSGQEVVVHTGMDERGPNDGACAYPFVVGVNYLVYASGRPDSLSTSMCTFTRPEVAVGAVLRELRAIRDGHAVDSLFGTISLLSPEHGPWLASLNEGHLLAGVPVRAIDSAGRVRSTTTDDRGVYAFEWLPPETYRIERDLPSGLRVLFDGFDGESSVDLTDQDSTRIGCLVDIRTREGERPPPARAETSSPRSSLN
ncbi:MAG TPA: hypothetical protein VN881_02580 [Candidatus Acidoferrales bacterium]|nr:hypothetical protein [Candidatus Acidoferrales bacterium]